MYGKLTDIVKSHKTLKGKTNGTVFFTMAKILHNNESFTDIA